MRADWITPRRLASRSLTAGSSRLERVGTQIPILHEECGVVHQGNLAEAPLPDAGEPMAVGECDRQSSVTRGAIVALGVVEPSGHAETQHQPGAAADLDQEMLAVAPGRRELGAFELRLQITGRSILQHARRIDRHLLDRLMERCGVDVLPEHFHVGEPGHDRGSNCARPGEGRSLPTVRALAMLASDIWS